MPDASTTPKNWFMYHGGYAHGGNAGSGSQLNSGTVSSAKFKLLSSIQTNGPILSVPAIVDGEIYVGLANSHDAPGSNGGTIQKYNILNGRKSRYEFKWSIDVHDRDSHGFTGMGCTPTVINNYVYFIGFNAKLYCLKKDDLSLVWVTDLRYRDPGHNQPITNIYGKDIDGGTPPAAGWSSPLVVNLNINGVSTPRVFVGVGEGENPNLYSFIFCLDGNTGNVVWIYCTCQYVAGQPNPVNQLPVKCLIGTVVPKMYSVFNGTPVTQGCSVWSAIAYDETTGLIYASTGQPASPNSYPDVPYYPGSPNTSIDKGLPSVGWSSGILALNAASGKFFAFTQMPASTVYRPTDLDVDIGGGCTIFNIPFNGFLRKVVGVGCKNGGFMMCDAKTLELIGSVSMLPKMNDGSQIPAIDPHPPANLQNTIFPQLTNEISNNNWGENYYGTFNTAAFDPKTGFIFVGIGGPNYHNQAPGIDYNTTPFMKAMKWNAANKKFVDAWPMDNSNPPRYKNVGASMYTTAGESGLSSPAIVNDVVFATTTGVSIYAFKVSDGSLLWSDVMGNPTLGFNGGYGYCIGAAIWGNYVVAGSLIQGLNGGLLNIYGLGS